MNRITFNEAEDCLAAFLSDKSVYTKGSGDDARNIGWLRAKAINSLIGAVIEAFRNNEESLREGRFNQDLISATSFQEAMQHAKKLATNKVFLWKRIQMAELAGIKMIHRLLDDLVGAIENPGTSLGRRAFTVLEPISSGAQPYYKLLAVTDYISGMTDRFLIESFERFSGSRID